MIEFFIVFVDPEMGLFWALRTGTKCCFWVFKKFRIFGITVGRLGSSLDLFDAS